ncbi:hypothetical protein FJY63_14595, partial [Candidatus Sumerlaeota bacterium]|nr:hypothetical protein [Candidatus Sumerlaeota bacterium]
YILLWSLLGINRACGSLRGLAALKLTFEQSDYEPAQLDAVGRQRLQLRQDFLLVATIVVGIGLVVFHFRPLAGALYLRCPKGMNVGDPRYFDRLDSARSWWPYSPRVYEIEAAHYRAKANAAQALSQADVRAITRAYEQMIRANPYDPMSHLLAAQWDIERRNIKQAIETLRRGLSLCPASFEMEYSLAAYYRQLKSYTLALRAYERARSLRPDSLPVLRNLISLELEVGEPAEARRWLQIARQIAPDDPGLKATSEAVATGRGSEPRLRITGIVPP